MWSAQYNSIDFNGTSPTVTVRVRYINGTPQGIVDESYIVQTDQVDSAEFKTLIQSRVDTLNAKSTLLAKTPASAILQQISVGSVVSIFSTSSVVSIASAIGFI